MPIKINGEELKEWPMTDPQPQMSITKHIVTNVKRSNSFVRTIDLQSEKDCEWLRSFRKEISDLNRFNRKHGLSRSQERIKVSANGRLGIDNPNAYKYRVGKSRSGSRFRQQVLLSDARYADIYVNIVADDKHSPWPRRPAYR